jgi:hypothetical protein
MNFFIYLSFILIYLTKNYFGMFPVNNNYQQSHPQMAPTSHTTLAPTTGFSPILNEANNLIDNFVPYGNFDSQSSQQHFFQTIHTELPSTPLFFWTPTIMASQRNDDQHYEVGTIYTNNDDFRGFGSQFYGNEIISSHHPIMPVHQAPAYYFPSLPMQHQINSDAGPSTNYKEKSIINENEG